jgi:voltage-gated potassium channel Kch
MRSQPDSSDLLVLRRKRRIHGWYELGWRVAAVAALIGMLVLFHWLEREGLKDTHDGHVSFVDVVYFTMISATTTGYGDIVPVTANTRLFDALVVTPIRIFFLLIFIGTAYLFVAKRTWERFLMRRIQRSLRDHTVVVGYGTKNTRAVAELMDLGAKPADIVVVDLDEERLSQAKAVGCTVLRHVSSRPQGNLRIADNTRRYGLWLLAAAGPGSSARRHHHGDSTDRRMNSAPAAIASGSLPSRDHANFCLRPQADIRSVHGPQAGQIRPPQD